MTKLSLRIAPVALVALLCAPVAVFAQTPSAPAGQTGPTTPAVTPTNSPPNASTTSEANPATESMQQRVDQRINQLHAELHITQAQEGQWHKFATVMRNNARTMEAAMKQRASEFGTMNAVQDLQSYAQLAQAHANDVKKLSAAFQSLYNSLPVAQRRLADQTFRAKVETHAAAAGAPATHPQ